VILGESAPDVRDLIARGDGRAVVVPPAGLLTAPWGLLPVFADVAVSVSPSATQWLGARQARGTGRSGHVALVTGPGLSTREAEVTALSPVHDGAFVLSAEQATVAAALEILDGAGLAHIAAHGTFRGDAPLFSSLELADGQLTVHDLEELRHPPRSIILSACDSGGVAPIGPHEALGLVSALLGMGTSDVLASVVPVNDHATLSIMAEVHAVAGNGGTLAEGWRAARKAAQGDVLHAATAASFTSWGA
jgi:CHAT domain-containing protein